jgi:hypothetical protein
MYEEIKLDVSDSGHSTLYNHAAMGTKNTEGNNGQ